MAGGQPLQQPVKEHLPSSHLSPFVCVLFASPTIILPYFHYLPIGARSGHLQTIRAFLLAVPARRLFTFRRMRKARGLIASFSRVCCSLYHLPFTFETSAICQFAICPRPFRFAFHCCFSHFFFISVPSSSFFSFLFFFSFFLLLSSVSYIKYQIPNQQIPTYNLKKLFLKFTVF